MVEEVAALEMIAEEVEAVVALIGVDSVVEEVTEAASVVEEVVTGVDLKWNPGGTTDRTDESGHTNGQNSFPGFNCFV